MEDKEFEQLKKEKMEELKATMSKTAKNIDKAFEANDNIAIEQYLKKFKHYIRSEEMQEGYELNRKYFKNIQERDYYIENTASLETYDIIMAEKCTDNEKDLFNLLENDSNAKEEYETIKSEITQIEIAIANKYQERNKKTEQIKQQKTEQITKKIVPICAISIWLIIQIFLVTGDWFTIALITMIITAGGLYQSKKLGLIERLIFQGINLFSVLTIFMNGLTHGATWGFVFSFVITAIGVMATYTTYSKAISGYYESQEYEDYRERMRAMTDECYAHSKYGYNSKEHLAAKNNSQNVEILQQLRKMNKDK